MKNIIQIIFVLLLSSYCYGQVGIGTTIPEEDLHVAGDLLVNNALRMTALPSVSNADEDFKLLTRNAFPGQLGEVKRIDVDQLNVAPVNVINYHITNINLDNLADLDLGYLSNRYIVAVSNFRYVGDGIEKIYSADRSRSTIGQFVVRTFESNNPDGSNTWHLEIQNRRLDLAAGDSVEYYVTLVVYLRGFFRLLPSITTDLNGQLNGTASSTPVLN